MALMVAVGCWLSGCSAGPAGPAVTGVEQLTSETAEELFPSLSPDGRFVAYASPAAGNWDVFVLGVEGGQPINLTADSKVDDTHPAFSPDGESIAFRSDRDGGGIFVMAVSGDSVRRIAPQGYHPDWSPDGRRLAYATGGAGRTPYSRTRKSSLRVVDLASGEDRLLYEGDATQPHWSPNGHRIAFWGFEDINRDILTIAADGGQPLGITLDAHVDWSPAWSADGKWLYFSSNRGGSMNLWRVAVDEPSGGVRGDLEAVASGAEGAEAWHAAFSRDGRTGVYSSFKSSTNIQRLALGPGARSVGTLSWFTRGTTSLVAPDVSIDGLIAYQEGRTGDIVISDLEGDGRHQLTDDSFRDSWPRWAPQGDRLAFFSNRGGSGFEIWSMRRDGTELEQLTFAGDKGAIRPVWSPDGTRLAFSGAAKDDYRAYVLELSVPWSDQEVFTVPSAQGVAGFQSHSWSRDGERLAGIGHDDGGPGVFVLSLATQTFELAARGSVQGVRWLGDGRTLLFVEDAQVIRAADTATGETWELLSIAPDTSSGLAPTPDGSELFFHRNARQADLWIVRLASE